MKKFIKKNLSDLLAISKQENEVPEDLKADVFHTIDQIELTADILDLFTFKYGRTEASLFADLEEE